VGSFKLALALAMGLSFVVPVQLVDATAVVQPLPSRAPVVAIIDSGIARTQELRSALTAEFDMAATPQRRAFQPRDDHGTMVATILLRAATRPIEIVSLRVDDPAGCPVGLHPPCQRDAAPLERAIRQATEMRVSAINISLTLKDDPGIVEAVRDAAARGITVVLAAGNEGRDAPGNLSMARAAYPNSVLVGALDSAGRPWVGTNRPQADARGYRYTWQRGVAVPTVLADGSKAVATGTSFAAPIETARLLSRADRPDAAGPANQTGA
jgi:subtilisin family serine protease